MPSRARTAFCSFSDFRGGVGSNAFAQGDDGVDFLEPLGNHRRELIEVATLVGIVFGRLDEAWIASSTSLNAALSGSR